MSGSDNGGREIGRSRRAVIVGIAAAVLVLALVATLVVRHHAASPDRLIEQYLDALEEGDTDTIRALLDLDGASTTLLDSVPAAPVDGAIGTTEIVDRTKLLDGFDYEVAAVQNGQTSHGMLRVQPVENPDHGAARWRLREDVPMSRLTVLDMPDEAAGVRINGVEFPVERVFNRSPRLELAALPGNYVVEAVPPNKYLRPIPDTATVRPTLGRSATGGGSVILQFDFSPAAVTDVQEKMDALVAECGEVDDAGMGQCDMAAPDPDVKPGSSRWEFHDQPVAGLTYVGSLRGSAHVPGHEQGDGPEATVTYLTSDSSEHPGQRRTMEVEYGIAGDVDITENGELVTNLGMHARPA